MSDTSTARAKGEREGANVVHHCPFRPGTAERAAFLAGAAEQVRRDADAAKAAVASEPAAADEPVAEDDEGA